MPKGATTTAARGNTTAIGADDQAAPPLGSVSPFMHYPTVAGPHSLETVRRQGRLALRL